MTLSPWIKSDGRCNSDRGRRCSPCQAHGYRKAEGRSLVPSISNGIASRYSFRASIDYMSRRCRLIAAAITYVLRTPAVHGRDKGKEIRL
jgi:hypothetical protein